MTNEYGKIHTDGSRSGGQPVLEPCPVPWCGSSDVKARSFDANHRRHWIECGKCNFKTPQMPSRTKVITLWNTRQPTHSNIFGADDVQKHTLIVDQDYASHTIKVKSLKDSHPTQSDCEVAASIRSALYRACSNMPNYPKGTVEPFVAAHHRHGYDQGYYDGITHPLEQCDALREENERLREHLISALDTLKDAEVCDDNCGPCNEARAALEQSK